MRKKDLNNQQILCRVDENLMTRINDNKARIKNKYGAINNFYKIAIDKEFCEFVKSPYHKDVELLNLKNDLKQIKKDMAEILKEKTNLNYYSQQIKYNVDTFIDSVKTVKNSLDEWNMQYGNDAAPTKNSNKDNTNDDEYY